MARQFVVQLENRPGELAHLARALAARWIDIVHIASVGSGSTACAFLTTSDAAATREVLHGAGFPFIEGDLVFAPVEDRPGGLADLTERLAAAGVNILAALTVDRRPGIVDMALAVDDEARALAVLAQPVLADTRS